MKLETGKTYRAKRPTRYGDGFNDRFIFWMSDDGEMVQYDSTSVALGRRYPKVTREKFLKWASHEVAE